jgi:hypothetical protein
LVWWEGFDKEYESIFDGSKQRANIPPHYSPLFLVMWGKEIWTDSPLEHDLADAANWLAEWFTELKRRCRETTLDEALLAFGDEAYGILMDGASGGDPDGKWASMIRRLRELKSTDRLDIKRAKAFPIEEAARRFGHEPRMGFIKCPFHDDSTASLKLFERTNTWKCFGCQAGGDVIDFATRSGMRFQEAARMLGG